MRTKLSERSFADYTKGEEIFNMVSHIVGGATGVVALVLCVVLSALHGSAMAVVTSAIYGVTLIAMYTMSSVYHGLRQNMGKKVMQVLDHCAIYFLIAGTYTVISLVAIRPLYPVLAWVIFAIQWGMTALAVTLTAIDLKSYRVFSMICYLVMGWCIIVVYPKAIDALTLPGFLWILAGGIVFSVGAVLYGLGKKHRYMHCLFHLTILGGTLLQFFGILFYVV
jgi:hemolysin III